MVIKGQNFRVFAALPPSDTYVCIASATNASITQTGNTEDASTKDTEGLFAKNQVVSTGWNAQVDANQSEISELQAIAQAFSAAASMQVGWDQTAGSQNRAAQNANFKRSGQALMNDFVTNFNDRETVNVSLQFQGTGALS